MRRAVYFSLALLPLITFSQDFGAQFERIKQDQAQSFRQFQLKNDSIFAQSILNSWHKVKLDRPMQGGGGRKPDQVPLFEGQDGQLNPKSWKNIKEDTVVYLQIEAPEKLESPAYYPELRKINFTYWGTDIKVRYPVDLTGIKPRGSGEKLLSDYWLQASKTGYQVLIEDLLSSRDAYKLPDFAFYLMVKSLVQRSGAATEDQVYQTWFLMSKASYACKIGFSKEKPVFLLGVRGEVYGKPYFKEEKVRYYAMDETDTQLFTYKNPSESTVRPLHLSISAPIELPLVPKARKFNFHYLDSSYHVEIFYNENITELISTFPNAGFASYLNSSACPLLQKSVHKAFDPLIGAMKASDKVKFLLAFMQSMPYQTDQSQFKTEKIFYPDEFLSYEYSDCDDRVVFLAYLIKEFVDLKVIAVTFPKHVALAVKFPVPMNGEHVVYQNEEYSFCDPTYFNAPIGAVIPQADFSKAKIISVR